MKYSCVILFLICSIYCKGQKYETSFSFGIPVSSAIDWTKPNYSLDLMFNKYVSRKSVVGIGITYDIVDLKPSNNILTYDRKGLTFFCSYHHHFGGTGKIKIIPQIRLGYSFLKNQMNEFNHEIRNSNGLNICEAVDFKFLLNEKFAFFAGVSFNSIFAKTEFASDINIPSIYVSPNNNTINQLKFKIGCTHFF